MDDWVAQRDRAVAHHAAEQQRRRAAEIEQARALIEQFVVGARERGLPVRPLRARSYRGRSYRTKLRGWYVHPSLSLAVGEDGCYYSLLVAPSPWAWLTGVTVAPHVPRLVVGEGARDGESIPLRTLLERALSG